MNDTNNTDDMLRDAAVDFFSSRPDRARLRNRVGHARPVDRPLWRESAELGWTCALLPESLGGLGLGLRDAAVLCEEAGRYLYAEPLLAAAIMPALLLTAAENGPATDVIASLAQTLIGGERLLTLAWQEAAGQLELPLPACVVDNGFLSGRKLFVPACEDDSIILVWAKTNNEPVLVAVDAGSEGVTTHRHGAGLTHHAEIVFERAVLLDARPLLHGDAARAAMPKVLAASRIALAAELSGLAAGCLTQTLEYVRERQQFERAIGSFQSIQHRCADLYIETELAAAAWRHALDCYENSFENNFDATADAAICAAKARAGDAAVRIGRESVQMHGAMGFCEEVDIGLYLRAALHGCAWLGSPLLLRRRFSALLASATEREKIHA